MATGKATKIAELERQYAAELKKIQDEADDPAEIDDDDTQVIIIRGKLKQKLIKQLGLDEEEAEEILDDVEETVEDGETPDDTEDDETEEKKPPVKKAGSKKLPTDKDIPDDNTEDPKPPPMHRYFGRKP